MIRTRAMIPEYMTTSRDWEEVEEGDEFTLGRPLTYRMTEYLEVSYRGLTVEEKLEQLREINLPVYVTYQAWRKGMKPAAIAIEMKVSVWAVYDRLQRAREFMGDRDEPQTPEDAIRWLEIHDPEAHQVWILAGYGWNQAQICEMLGLSLRTVQRALARAREKAGRLDRATMRHKARAAIQNVAA